MDGQLFVIIPTYRRPESVSKLLASLAEQSFRPAGILVIDQSGDQRTRQVCESTENLPVHYHHLEQPSVNKARNLGLDLCANADFISILDDDLILDRDYFKVCVEALCEDVQGKFCAAMGSMSNISSRAPTWMERFFLMPASGNGEVLRSGFATTPHWNREPVPCRFVSAGLGVYRAPAIRQTRFDERMLGGAPCEDSDISARIMKFGWILYAPQAACVHEEAASNRLGRYKLVRAIIQNTYYLGKKNRHIIRFSRLAFAWAWLGMLLKYGLDGSLIGVAGVCAGGAKVLTGRLDTIR